MNPPNGSKPFDLAAALGGEPVVTRSGLSVTRIQSGSCPVHRDKPLVVYAGIGTCGLYTRLDGKHMSDGSECAHDLFMAPKTKKVWVNIYGDAKEVQFGQYISDSAKEAERVQVKTYDGLPYLKTIELDVPA